MPNWTAMRYKFKRSRRAQLFAGLAALFILFTLNSIIASFLRPDAPPPPVVEPPKTPVETTRIEVVPAVTEWRLGDYWVWADRYGLRVVDRVVDVTYVGTETNKVPLYHVQREASAADGSNPRVDNLTYDARTLAVVDHVASSYSVDWKQRTLGLTYFNKDGGFVSNASVDFANGKKVFWYRVANVTDADTGLRASVPAGRFTDVKAAEIQYYDVDLQRSENSRVVTWLHWFSPSVANDVRFTLTNGTMLELVGYRSVGGFVPAPDPPVAPRWRVGQSWTYSDGAGAERRVEVVAAKDGVVTVRTTVRTDASNLVDTAHHRASDLAVLDYTSRGIPFRLEPSGVPIFPENGTFPYTKYVDAAGPERAFVGNATAVVKHGAVIATGVGDIEAVRILIIEDERGWNGDRATFQTVRYYAPSVANDVRLIEPNGRTWTLTAYDLGPRPLRGDALPPPS